MSAPQLTSAAIARLPALACLTIVLSGASACASHVQYTLELNPGAGGWKLFAEASPGDNGGIASVGVTLTEIDEPVDLLLPQAIVDLGVTTFSAAFGQLRSDVNPIGGTQGIFGTGGLVYGMGQVGGDLEATFGGIGVSAFFVQPQYDAKLLVAMGTYNPAGPEPAFSTAEGEEPNAFVFLSDGGVEFETPTTIGTEVVVIPEPTAALLGLIALGVAPRRRR